MHPPLALRHCGNELILCLPLRASRHSMGTRDLTRCRRERQEANISFLLPWRLRVLACDPQSAAAANGTVALSLAGAWLGTRDSVM